MKKLKVSSLPLKEVISDIAEQMSVEFSTNCGIYQVRLPQDIGSGIIIAADFDDGLGLIQYDCTFYEDVAFDFSVEDVHPVKFLFCREGRFDHQFLNESEWHELPQYKNAIVASSAHYGHTIRFYANERTIFSSLELERRKFQSKISCEPKTIAKSWRKMLNDVTAKNTFYHDGFYSLQLAEQFDEWGKFDDNDFLKKLHLEGLAYQILVFQIMQFQDDLKSEGRKTILRKAELTQFEKAVRIIEQEMEDLPTVSEIAREVGLNPQKLQQGFKELFGKTVNDFITDKRLDMAWTLLINSDHTLMSISSRIGYNNPSYLSKMFRERYGVTPSEFRRRSKKEILVPESILDLNR